MIHFETSHHNIHYHIVFLIVRLSSRSEEREMIICKKKYNNTKKRVKLNDEEHIDGVQVKE